MKYQDPSSIVSIRSPGIVNIDFFAAEKVLDISPTAVLPAVRVITKLAVPRDLEIIDGNHEST